jgi:hypothetical protein
MDPMVKHDVLDRQKADIGPSQGKHAGSQQFPGYDNLEAVESTDISLGTVLKGAMVKPLTTFEKKAALINAEMDKFGLGRYQLCIWFLCGFGYFLDLAWAQGVGLIASAIYQEMDVAPKHYGDLFACANAGLAVGALFWGIMVDM